MIANSILKQLIIPEYHMEVYYKGGSNANGRTSAFDVSHYQVKTVVPERKQCFSSKSHIFYILILSSYSSRTLVRISFHQQLHPKPHYEFDIPDVP